MTRFLIFLASTLIAVVPATMLAQDETAALWQLVPGIHIIDLFPSRAFVAEVPYGSPEYTYSGFGFSINARAIKRGIDHVAFTFGGGAIWFQSSYSSGYISIRPASDPASDMTVVTDGIGQTLRNKQFTMFPLMAGLEAEFPSTQDRNFVVFVGGNLSANFIDGAVDINQQVKGGYGFTAGFVVRPFEFGVRYNAFSDIRNLGASIGIQLNSIRIN